MSAHREHAVAVTSAADHGSRALKAILAGGLIGGAFDITYACVVWAFRGVSPIRIGQSVASGLLGRDAALAGGVATGLLGFALHFGMTLIMADSSALTAGVVTRADERIRGATMAVHSMLGFGTGFVAPLVFGVVLDLAGGNLSPLAWGLAFMSLGAGAVFMAGFIRSSASGRAT